MSAFLRAFSSTFSFEHFFERPKKNFFSWALFWELFSYFLEVGPLLDLYDRSDQRDISQLFGNLFWDSPMESFHIIYIPRQLITLHHSSSYHSWIMMKCVLISCHPFPCDTYKTYLCISILLLFFLFWIWNKFILASS